MARLKRTFKNLRREEGFTLPELLLAAALLVGLFATMGSALTVIAGTQPRVADRSNQVQAGRTMIEQLTRELREGSDVTTATPSAISFVTFVRTQACGSPQPALSASSPAVECRVTYSCTAGRCMRTEAPPNDPGSGATREMLDGLRSSEVFAYSPVANPNHVTVTLEYPDQDGAEAVTLMDGVGLRNVG